MADHEDDSAEDLRLAHRVIGRDAAAEASLCARLFPRIRAYVRRHLRDPGMAGDLAQNVTIAVLEALRAGRVEQLERLPAFVMGTCRNTVQDWRRGERRRRSLLERFGPTFVAAVEPPDAIDGERLTGCLDRLPQRERSIVTLTFFAERSGDDMAKELGMSAIHVRVARHRALRQLRECLEGEPS